MSILACLDQPPPARAEMLVGDGLFNIAGTMIFGCIALVTLFAPLIRRAYRNHVVRLMGLDQVHPRPAAWWERHAPSSEASSGAAPAMSVGQILKQARAAENRLTLATAAAWLAFTLIAWPLGKWILQEPSLLGQMEFLAISGLLALVPLYANLPPRNKQKVFWVCVVIAAIVLIGLEAANHSAENQPAAGVEEESSPWDDLFAVLLSSAVVYILFHRRLRGLVFPVSAVFTAAVLVIVVPLALIEPHLGSCLSGFHPSSSEGAAAEQVWSSGFAFAFAVLFVLGLWLGFQMIGALARLIEKGYLGDLSMISLIGLALVGIAAVYWAVGETEDSYSAWVTWVPLLWLLVPVAVYRLLLHKQTESGPGHDLLVLRVFSRDKKKQVFLDQLQSRWRYMGAVNLAGGPDMVDLNVDTYECAMFLSSHMHELFLPEALDAQHLAARFSNQSDQEGRYRINEMFNFNTAWRENVEQLILLSKTILLDVRGLTTEREGTSFEIGLLAKNDLLDRVIAVGDDDTDWQHIERQLERAGKNIQQLKRTDSGKDMDSLISKLLDIQAAASA